MHHLHIFISLTGRTKTVNCTRTEKTILPIPLTLNGICDHGDSFPFDLLNQMEFHLVQNQKENCHHDHIPFNLTGKGMLVFSVYV